MNSALRPMSTGEVLDRTFNLYRNNFLLLAGISALPPAMILTGQLLMMLIGFLPSLAGRISPVAVGIGIGAYGILLILVYLIGYALAIGATVFAVSRIHLGHTTTIRESYRSIGRRVGTIIRIVITVWLRSVGVFLLAYLSLTVPAIVIPNVLKSAGGSVAGTGTLFVIFAVTLAVVVLIAGGVFAIRIYCQYSLAVPAAVLERLKARESLRRSKSLSKGSLLRIFLVYSLLLVMSLSLAAVFVWIPASIGATIGQTSAVASIIATIWSLIGTFISSTIAAPIGAIAVSLIYYDQRVRKEAFDLQVMMESIGQSGPEQATLASPGIG